MTLCKDLDSLAALGRGDLCNKVVGMIQGRRGFSYTPFWALFYIQMIEVLTTTDSQKLLHQLNALLEQESRCQPKVCGLRLIESAHDNGLRMTARLRDFEVKDLLSLTQFFGFDSETFSLAVNLLDRFLSKMKVCLKLHYTEYFLVLLNVFWRWKSSSLGLAFIT